MSVPSDRSARGVSTTVGYVLTLGITTLLVTGLLATTGGLVDTRQETATRDALDVFGQRVAANLMAADRLAESGADTVVLDVTLPNRVAGSGYVVTVHGSGSGSEIELESNRIDASATIEFVTTTDVADAELRGTDLRIVLTAANELEVRAA